MGQGEGKEFEGDQISVIESILHHAPEETPEYLQSWANLQKSLLEKRAMSDYLIDGWQREFK